MPDPHEIERADASARTRALVWLLVSAAVGVSMLWLVEDRLDRLLAASAEDPEGALASARRFVLLLGIAASATLAVLAALTARVARRVSISGRFPPPGVRVIQDTRVREGREARRLALGGYVMAILLAGAAVALPLKLYRLLSLLSGS